jgi:DNA-binding response OmpR family regulator
MKSYMKKILLIDDDPDVQTVLRVTLQQQGYVVATASRKEEAWQRLSEELPSLILLDVLLSGADGRELCRELKATPATKDIPVIMFSGHPSAGIQFKTYGADDFIAKPLNTKILLEKLNHKLVIQK